MNDSVAVGLSVKLRMPTLQSDNSYQNPIKVTGGYKHIYQLINNKHTINKYNTLKLKITIRQIFEISANFSYNLLIETVQVGKWFLVDSQKNKIVSISSGQLQKFCSVFQICVQPILNNDKKLY